MKAIQIRNWVRKDTEDDEDMIMTLCDIIADCVNNPDELQWVKDSVESSDE